MFGYTIECAIYNNDAGLLRYLLNKQYYQAKFPTMSDEMVEKLKIVCVNYGKHELLDAFKKYDIVVLDGNPPGYNNAPNFPSLI